MMATVSTVAHELAAAHPQAKLPCPICANTLNASNLASHVAKVHAGARPVPWRGRRWGILPARLALAEGAIVLKTLLGKRVVSLPCTVQVGALVGSQVSAGMTSYADDMNVPATTVKTGWYMRLGDRITIGCKTAANVKAHWTGWEPGPQRRITDAIVERRVLVEIEYALAAAGALGLRASRTEVK